MDSLQINTGEIRLSINGDTGNQIVFNPSDILFAEKFYRLIGSFQVRVAEYKQRAEELERSTANDENGLPVNMEARIEHLKEACAFIRSEIDKLFGEGTSLRAFGETLNLDVFIQFFRGITPYVKKARSEKVIQYTTPAANKRVKHKK